MLAIADDETRPDQTRHRPDEAELQLMLMFYEELYVHGMPPAA